MIRYMIGDKLICHNETNYYSTCDKFRVGDIAYINDKFKEGNIIYISICTEYKWNFDNSGDKRRSLCGGQVTFKSTEISEYFNSDEIRHKKTLRIKKLGSL